MFSRSFFGSIAFFTLAVDAILLPWPLYAWARYGYVAGLATLAAEVIFFVTLVTVAIKVWEALEPPTENEDHCAGQKRK